MQNKDIKIIRNDETTDDVLVRCADLLGRIDDLLLGFEPLAEGEARHIVKLPRDSGDAIVGGVAEQCRAFGLTRVGHEATVDAMLDALGRARAAREAVARLECALERLHAERVRAESAAWSAALTFYGVMRRLAVGNARLEASLMPLVGYFRKRRRKGVRRRGTAGRENPKGHT